MPEIAVSTCASCGAPLVRRETEKPHKFAKRLTCGYTCGAKASSATAAHRAAIAEDERPRFIICKTEPFAVDKRNRLYVHCGGPECRKAAQRGDHVKEYASTGWPERTVPVIMDFGPHELSLPAEAMFRMARPLTYSDTGCSAAWVTGE